MRLVLLAEIVRDEAKRQHVNVVLPLARKRIRQARVATVGHAKRQVAAFNVARADVIRIGIASANDLARTDASRRAVARLGGTSWVRREYLIDLRVVDAELFKRLKHGANVSWMPIGAELNASIQAAGEIAKFTGDTVSGNVFLDITGTPDQVRVNTVSGNVTTRLAADVAAQYTINTVGGRLQLDESEIRGIRGGYSGKFGTLDKHWLDFKANTVSGDVSVLHASVPA